MSISQTYYLDNSSFADSSSVFSNSDMSLYAPDGFYSDGSISRQQVGGILGLPTTCPSCLIECGFSGNRVADEPLVDIYNVNVLSNLGAIIIRFYPNLLISGILVQYDSVYYNKVSSFTEGPLNGLPSNKETYLGETASCPLPISPASETVPIYKFLNGSWYDTGSNETISILAPQVQTTTLNPGECVMVIPKPNTTPSTLNVKIVSPCPNSGYDLTIECPNYLPEFIGSQTFVSPSSPEFCGEISGEIYYFVSVNSSPTVGLYDWVFLDSTAQNYLPDGWYRLSPFPAPNDTIQVLNGTIITVTDSSIYCG